MAANTTHKFWFQVFFNHDNHEELFYISVPIKDKGAIALISRIRSYLHIIDAYILPTPAIVAYADIRSGISHRSFQFALDCWHNLLSIYYTNRVQAQIFMGY